MNRELEEQRELAAGRLAELETLQSQYQSSLRTCEQLTMDVSRLVVTCTRLCKLK